MAELIDENLRDSSLGVEGAVLEVEGAVLGVEVNDDVENNQVMDDGYEDRVGPAREALDKLSPEDLHKLLQELDQAGGVADPQNLEFEVNDASEALSAVCLDCGGVTEPDPECKSCKNPLATLVCSRCQNVKYCNEECQREDWSRHKQNCLTKVEQSRHNLGIRLYMASGGDSVPSIAALLKKGADIHYVWIEQAEATPFMAAVLHLAFGSIDFLISAGVRVDDVDINGSSALHMACMFGHKEEEQALALERHPDLTMEASILRVVNTLIAARANVNQVDFRGRTPLSHASGVDYPSIVDSLIKAGSTVDHVNTEFGGTPLTFACESNCPNVLQVLITAGANVNHRKFDGSTALMFASQLGSVEVVRVLLAAGANVSDEKNNGVTALFLAKHFNRFAVVALLEARLA